MLVVSFVGVFIAWFLLWPYSGGTILALVAAAVLAVFCALASWMRSHDDEWESAHLRTRPILSPRRIRNERKERKAEGDSRPKRGDRSADRVAAKEQKKAEKAERAARKAAEKAQPIPGYEELANLKGRDGDPVVIPTAGQSDEATENGAAPATDSAEQDDQDDENGEAVVRTPVD